MTQHLAHFLERGTTCEELGRGRVPQPMGTEASDPELIAGAIDGPAHYRRAHRPEQGAGAKEQRSGRHRQSGPAPPEVSGDRLPNVDGEGKAFVATSLAMHDYFAGAPVEILESEGDDLPSSKSESPQAVQHGIVLPADRRPAVTDREETPGHARLKSFRQCARPPVRDGRDRRVEAARDETLDEREAQEAAKADDDVRRRGRAPSLGLAEHEAGYLFGAEVTEVEVGLERAEEGPDGARVKADRVLAQAAFCEEWFSI